jgi:hypothetical protein
LRLFLDQHRDPRICAEYIHPGGREVMCLEKGEGPPLSSLAMPTIAGHRASPLP